MGDYGPKWPARRKERLEMDDWTCQDCGDDAWQVHHIEYAPEGETASLDMLVSLCPYCHGDRHDREYVHPLENPRRTTSVRIHLRQNQAEWIDENYFDLQSFVQDKLDEFISGRSNRSEGRAGPPIHWFTVERKSGVHNLSGNELRATYVFDEFFTHAIIEDGLIKLSSTDVREIHQEHGLDTNPNTIKRTMQMVAKHSADLPMEVRSPDHTENLIRLRMDDKYVLVADEGGWMDYLASVGSSINESPDTQKTLSTSD